MIDQRQLDRLRDALAREGFEFSTTRKGCLFRGQVETRGVRVGLDVRFDDLSFVQPPIFTVRGVERLGRPVVPHVDEDHTLCVVDARQYVFDRYAVAEMTLGLVGRARQLIADGTRKSATAEIAREFPQHWGGRLIVRFDIDPAYGGRARCRRTEAELCVLPQIEKRKSSVRPAVQNSVPAWIARSNKELSFTDNQKRPDTFGELLAWARDWDDALAENLLAGAADLGPRNSCFGIVAPNGIVGGLIDFGPEKQILQKVWTRPGAWEKQLRGGHIDSTKLTRFRGRSMPITNSLARNFEGASPLENRKVLLVGCGSIGGYLAKALAQMGAGRRSGRLDLIDPDELDAGNIGRHWLGTAETGKNKAVLCRARIETELPGASIYAWPHAAESHLMKLAQADLVIDATGEFGVADLLNFERLAAMKKGERWADVLHVRIWGRGAAVQTLFCSGADFGCFRCAEPEIGVSRISPLRADAPLDLQAGCGEPTFTPYGPSAPVLAAGLAAAHLADWAGGNAKPYVRTINIDATNTTIVKAKNLEKSVQCPACGAAAA